MNRTEKPFYQFDNTIVGEKPPPLNSNVTYSAPVNLTQVFFEIRRSQTERVQGRDSCSSAGTRNPIRLDAGVFKCLQYAHVGVTKNGPTPEGKA